MPKPFFSPLACGVFCLASSLLGACGASDEPSTGWIARGTATVQPVEIAPTDGLIQYKGPIAVVPPANVRGTDAVGVDVHLYARDPTVIFGPRHWYINADHEMFAMTWDDRGLQDRAQTAFTMPQDATVFTGLDVPGNSEIEIFYSQGEDIAYCIEMKLAARRCRETNGLGCESALEAQMKDHADCDMTF